MKKWIIYAGLFLCVQIIGCSSDFLESNSEVTVTVRGESAFGEWQRNFVGPESDAEDFANEAARIANDLAEQFGGSVQVRLSIDEQEFKEVQVTGNHEEIVVASILASHDITALRLGFMPQGNVDQLSVPTTIAGNRPCTCVGSGCCCSSDGECGNIFLSCEGCGRSDKKGICAAGTQCWFANQEDK